VFVLLFIALPVLDLVVLFKAGSHFGALPVLLYAMTMVVVGANLIRWGGWRAMARVQQDLQRGVMPDDSILNGLMVVVAGLLFIVPGFITDILGFLLLLPPFRRLAAFIAKRHFAPRIVVGGFGAGPPGGFDRPSNHRDDVIDLGPDKFHEKK
jgi:UPF0716 protein FxsA